MISGLTSFFTSPAIEELGDLQPDLNLSYSELPCSTKEKDKIYDLISTIGEQNEWSLYWHHQTRLEEIGKEIIGIHPYKFLGVIYTDYTHSTDPKPNCTLKKCMELILNTYFKKNAFIDGLKPKMSSEKKKGTLTKYLDDFAKKVHANAASLQDYIDKEEWENFIKYLTYNCN
jgi:hypothetical protein